MENAGGGGVVVKGEAGGGGKGRGKAIKDHYKSYPPDSNSSKNKIKMQAYTIVFKNTMLIKWYN